MILEPNILLSFGLPIDETTDTSLLESAIENAEMITISEAIGADNLERLNELKTDNPNSAILNGGSANETRVAGYYRASSYLAMSQLLFLCDTQVTSFGAVKKKTDYSNSVNPWDSAKRYEAMGLKMLADLCKVLGWEYNTPTTLTTEI